MSAVALVVLASAVVLFGVRLVIGPTLADRVVALNGIIVVGMVLVAIDAMRADRSAFLPVLVVLAVVGFVGTAMIARFLQGRGR